MRGVRFHPAISMLLFASFTISAGCYDSLIKTLEITVLIMFLVAASNFFGAVFSSLGTPKMLTEVAAIVGYVDNRHGFDRG